MNRFALTLLMALFTPQLHAADINCWDQFKQSFKGHGSLQWGGESPNIVTRIETSKSESLGAEYLELASSGITFDGNHLGQINLVFKCINNDYKNYEVYMSKYNMYHDVMTPILKKKIEGIDESAYTSRELIKVGVGGCNGDMSGCGYNLFLDEDIQLTQFFSNITGDAFSNRGYVQIGKVRTDFDTLDKVAQWKIDYAAGGCYSEWKGNFKSDNGSADLHKTGSTDLSLEIRVTPADNGNTAVAKHIAKIGNDGQTALFDAQFTCINGDPRQFVVKMKRSDLTKQVVMANGFQGLAKDLENENVEVVGVGSCTDLTLADCTYTIDLTLTHGLKVVQRSMLKGTAAKPKFDLSYYVRGSRVYSGANIPGMTR